MANSTAVSAGDDVLASQYNNLRKDALHSFSLTSKVTAAAGDLATITDDLGIPKLAKLAGTLVLGSSTSQQLGTSELVVSGVSESYIEQLTESEFIYIWKDGGGTTKAIHIQNVNGDIIWDNSKILTIGTSPTVFRNSCNINSTQILIFFGTNGYVLTNTSGTLTLGAAANLTLMTNGDFSYNSLMKIDSNKIIMSSIYNAGSPCRVESVIITISGTTITYGARQDSTGLGGSFSQSYCALAYLNINKVLCSYLDTVSGAVRCQQMVITVSGTTITYGTRYTHSQTTMGSPAFTPCTVGIDSSTVFCEIAGRASIVTVAGTVVSNSVSQVDLTSSDYINLNRTLEKLSGDKVYLAGTRSGKSGGRVIEYSGTTVGAVGAWTEWGSENVDNAVKFKRISDNYAIIEWSGNVNTISFDGRIVISGSYIGVYQAGVTAGATGTIITLSGISEAHTGLTIGQKYFIGASGELTATNTNNGTAGTAISATQLLIHR